MEPRRIQSGGCSERSRSEESTYRVALTELDKAGADSATTVQPGHPALTDEPWAQLLDGRNLSKSTPLPSAAKWLKNQVE